jgi:hypothetical protein
MALLAITCRRDHLAVERVPRRIFVRENGGFNSIELRIPIASARGYLLRHFGKGPPGNLDSLATLLYFPLDSTSYLFCKVYG